MTVYELPVVYGSFDAKVVARRAKLEAARQARLEDMGLSGQKEADLLPETFGIKDLVALTPYEEEAINSILSCVDPDDIFVLLEDANLRDRVTFIAGFVLGKSI